MKQHNQPIIAIIGRPNVGKSTLFNRIIGRRQASVYDLPGLTRDRNYALAQWGNKTFLLVDTGGYEIEEQDDISKGVREQVLMAMDEADAIVFLTEVALSDHPVDHEIIHMLRRSSKPFAVAVNKCDNQEQQMDAYAMAALGADHLHIISATHGLGIGELLDDITKTLPADEEGDEPADDQIRVAIVGRQNVGKSTLTNRILGTERVLATPVAGTTRDAVDTPFHFNGKDYIIVDTAGIRRRGKIEHGPESLSVTSSIMSIQRCDVAILVLDARDGITAQDTHIGGYIQESGRAAIIAVNKWDAVEKDTATAGTFAK
ncbi:MAG TPA: ribosome biogenesis GTPase Der, partial [Candidatus Sumerlaeota bacterium]|nr:ribosome biogenesis GTPase Der [Candidatus Sumerlaeota bacterium]